MMQLIELVEKDPKKLFLIDGLGAMLSAVLLGVVLVKLERVFGIPPATLYLLAAFPILFAIYDLFSYRQENDKTGPLLRGIAIMNLLYCCLSIGLALYHIETVTAWGWAYIITEISIIITLAVIELRIANRKPIQNTD